MKFWFTVIGFFFAIGTTDACTCVPMTMKQKVDNAEIIVVGTVLRIDTAKVVSNYYAEQFKESADSLWSYLDDILKIQLRVERFYKGKIQITTATIFTSVGGGNCRYNFAVGEKYVVYLYLEPHKFLTRLDSKTQVATGFVYSTNICSGTTRYVKQEETKLAKLFKSRHLRS